MSWLASAVSTSWLASAVSPRITARGEALARTREESHLRGRFTEPADAERRPRLPGLLGQRRRGARSLLRPASPRGPDLAPPAARGHHGSARPGAHELLGDRALRGCAPHLA